MMIEDLKVFLKLLTTWKQPSSYYNTYNNSLKGSTLFSIAYGF